MVMPENQNKEKTLRVLIKLARKNKQTIFFRLCLHEFEANLAKGVRMACHRLALFDSSVIEDLHSEMRFIVYNRLQTFLTASTLRNPSLAGLGNWVTTTSRRETLRLLRQHKISPVPTRPTAEGEYTRSEHRERQREIEALWHCLARLDSLDAHILFLRHGKDFSGEDLQKLMQEKEATGEKDAEEVPFSIKRPFLTKVKTFVKTFLTLSEDIPHSEQLRGFSFKEIHTMLQHEEGFKGKVGTLRKRFLEARRQLIACLLEHGVERRLRKQR